MTQAEVWNEIDKMTLSEKRALWERLSREIGDQNNHQLDQNEEVFIQYLFDKGLLSTLPLQSPDAKIRQKFKRISIKGRPLSDIMFEERR